MIVWLMMTGEPLESFGERPHRIGILSKKLIASGHDVVWWTTSYDHQHKNYLYNEDTECYNEFGVEMFYLHSDSNYQKNVSFARIINHKQVAKKFKTYSSRKLTKPDIIFCCFPTIDLAYEAVQYGNLNRIPVVIDVRDLWPDIFKNLLPLFLKPFARLLLLNMYKKTSHIFRNASAITGITDKFVEYGLGFAQRNMSEYDRSFPFGYPVPEFKNADLIKTKDKLASIIDWDKYIICFFGTIGKQFDFDPIFEAADNLKNENILFVICGKGDMLQTMLNKGSKYSNVVFPGWLNNIEIVTIMRHAKAGISPYINSIDFLTSLSNKSIEYLAGSLPVLSSIQGVSGKLLIENNCGLIYNGDSTILTNYIEKLKCNEHIRISMSKNARNLYEKSYSDSVVYSEMISYLEMTYERFKYSNN